MTIVGLYMCFHLCLNNCIEIYRYLIYEFPFLLEQFKKYEDAVDIKKLKKKRLTGFVSLFTFLYIY